MAPWLLWFLPSFEAGFWSALVAGKLRDRGKTRELLVYGSRSRTSLPLIDERLRKPRERRRTRRLSWPDGLPQACAGLPTLGQWNTQSCLV